MSFKSHDYPMFNISVLLIAVILDFMETAANFNDMLPSLHLYDGGMFGVNMSKCHFFITNSSVKFNEKIDCVLHMQLSIMHDLVSVEDSSLAVAVLNQFDSFPYSTVNDEILGKSSKLEMFAAGAIIGTVTVVLLLSTCVILLVINLHRVTRAAIDYEAEQSQYNPAVTVAATVKSRAAAEDVQISQPSVEPPQQVSSKTSECYINAKMSPMSSRSCRRILAKICEAIQTNQKLINLLISKADSALQTKTNTTSLESELAELQKSMNKWKNNAKKFKMESDHHKRQESYLEDRCEELIKHNEHLMNFFKTLNEQKSSNHTDEVLTDEEISYPVQEENLITQNEQS